MAKKARKDKVSSVTGQQKIKKYSKVDIKQALDACINPEEMAYELVTGIQESNGQTKLKYLELYFKYRFGLPKKHVDYTSAGEKMDFNIVKWVQGARPSEIEESAKTINIDDAKEVNDEEQES